MKDYEGDENLQPERLTDTIRQPKLRAWKPQPHHKVCNTCSLAGSTSASSKAVMTPSQMVQVRKLSEIISYKLS